MTDRPILDPGDQRPDATPEAALEAASDGPAGGPPPPSGTGCVECLATGGWWFHLRRCITCGHIGCCDSSPSQHARHHAADTAHAVAASFEPGEGWFWDFAAETEVEGPELPEPLHHPLDQPTPGPAGRVPLDWRARLH